MSKEKNKGFLSEPWLKYTLGAVLIYGLLLLLRYTYPTIINISSLSWLKLIYPEFMTADDIKFNQSFVEWFGVMYGFLLPLILVKAWDQYETVEKEFDKELDTIKILYEDFLLLPKYHEREKKLLLSTLLKYAHHVKLNYRRETSSRSTAREDGNEILRELRKNLSDLFNSADIEHIPPPLMTQLLTQLNTAFDVRGDRISSSTQRFFKRYIRVIAVIASFVWLIPFYFLDLNLGIFGDILVVGLTFLILMILHIIEDLDEPFYKEWKLGKKVWETLEIDIEKSLHNLPNRPTTMPE